MLYILPATREDGWSACGATRNMPRRC